MRVVCNTSPLTNLAAIGELDLLPQLFGEIHIADAVWEELNQGGKRYPGSHEVESATWIRRHSLLPHPLASALLRDLDRGETHTLALALELRADAVLLDEKEGRRTALRLGLDPLGVLGVLLRAKHRGLLDSVRPSLVALREEAGFYVTDSLFERVLKQAGEI